MKLIMIIMLAIVAGNAMAVNKCKGDDGKVVYKTGPCVKSSRQNIDGGNFSSVNSDEVMTRGHVVTRENRVLLHDVRTGKSVTVDEHLTESPGVSRRR